MYRPPSYVEDNIETLHAAIRSRRFATIGGVVNARVHFAYAPVLLDAGNGPKGSIRFHLARGNPLAAADRIELRLSFLGPDAYISPDWYEGRQFVPTWNYIAVEASGTGHALDEGSLQQLLIDLSAQEEVALLPKNPWTLEKLPQERIAALLKAIRGYELQFETLEGKFKLSQDKSAVDAAAAAAGLERRGDFASLAIAAAMRNRNNSRS